MKHTWLALVLLAPALILADERPPFICRIPLHRGSPQQEQDAVVHALSANAEAVAPSRHRAAVPPGGPAIQFPPTVNFVDSDLFAAMKTNNVAPAQLASDEEFLRRVTLDLTGQIPDSATVQS